MESESPLSWLIFFLISFSFLICSSMKLLHDMSGVIQSMLTYSLFIFLFYYLNIFPLPGRFRKVGSRNMHPSAFAVPPLQEVRCYHKKRQGHPPLMSQCVAVWSFLFCFVLFLFWPSFSSFFPPSPFNYAHCLIVCLTILLHLSFWAAVNYPSP